jgi:hypothetical protein
MILVSPLQAFHLNSNQVPRVVYRVQVGERSFDLYIQSPSLVEQPGMEVAVPLALLPAMRLGQPIHVQGALSQTFLEGLRRIVDHYAASFEEFTSVAITADSYYEGQPATSQRKACFFSGGVDSFFSLLKAKEELTDIITIRGFDMSLSDSDRWQKTSSSAQSVADELGIQLHEVECNFGSIIKAYGKWVEHGYGIVLACVARSLAGLMGEVRIPGSADIDHQIPFGSSIFTDPQYSDERLTIVHDTCPANRIDKIVAIAHEPLAHQYLRVCPGTRNDGNYNCCRCEKCMRTMVTFYAIGVFDHVSAFHLPLTPKLVASALLTTSGHQEFTDENIQTMERYRPDDRGMLKALHIQRNRPFWILELRLKLRRKRRHLMRKINKLRHRSSL